MQATRQYYLGTLRFLMGPMRRDDLLPGWRMDMIGKPEEVQAAGDKGLSRLEIGPGGICFKRDSKEVGGVFLPIPFSVDDLRCAHAMVPMVRPDALSGPTMQGVWNKLGFMDSAAEDVVRQLVQLQAATPP